MDSDFDEAYDDTSSKLDSDYITKKLKATKCKILKFDFRRWFGDCWERNVGFA